MTENTPTAIFGRILEPKADCWNADAARFILSLTLEPVDQERVALLSEKAQESLLAHEEEQELDCYIRVCNMLALLKSKARLFLNEAPAVGP